MRHMRPRFYHGNSCRSTVPDRNRRSLLYLAPRRNNCSFGCMFCFRGSRTCPNGSQLKKSSLILGERYPSNSWADAPPFVGRILGGNLGHPHETERLRGVGTQSGRYHPLGLIVHTVLQRNNSISFKAQVSDRGWHCRETVGGQFVRRMFHTGRSGCARRSSCRDGQRGCRMLPRSPCCACR